MANRRTEQELIVQAIKREWICGHSELRLGQMIWNIASSVVPNGDVFTMTDEQLLAGLRNLDCCRFEKR